MLKHISELIPWTEVGTSMYFKFITEITENSAQLSPEKHRIHIEAPPPPNAIQLL